VRKKLILGLAGILVVGSAVAMGTRAYFSQQGEVKSNVFSTGTLALKLSDSDEFDSDETTATWSIAAGGPGDLASGTVNIKNAGNIVADHIEITAINTVTEAASGPGAEATVPLDTVLEITVLTYDGVDVLPQVSNANGNGIKDLDDLEKTTLDNLALTDLNVDHPLAMTVRFEPVRTVAEHQGDSVTTTLTVTLNQDSSQ